MFQHMKEWWHLGSLKPKKCEHEWVITKESYADYRTCDKCNVTQRLEIETGEWEDIK